MVKKWNIGWGTIKQCNMSCQFCYSKDVRDNKQALGLKDWKRFIDENSEYIGNINYGTGENAISDEWFELVDYIATNYEIKQALTTNGFAFERVAKNPRYHEILRRSITEVDVSLDFSDREKHNAIRGQSEAYDWAINMLDYCQKNAILATIVFIGIDETLTKENIDGLFKIGKKYNAKLRMNIFRPTMQDVESKLKFSCSYDSIVNILQYINEVYKILAISDSLFSSILTDNAFETDPSGDVSLRILSDGSITPSTYLITDEFIIANINESNVLYKVSNMTDRGIDRVIPSDCQNCDFVDRCNGGVYDRRYLWYGKFDERDPYCPFRLKKKLPNNMINIDKTRHFKSIHHGYLPTMFFEA